MKVIDFVQQNSLAYDFAVHWRHNLLLVPFWEGGQSLVQELAKLFTAYKEGGALECITIKAAMVMCSLLSIVMILLRRCYWLTPVMPSIV